LAFAGQPELADGSICFRWTSGFYQYLYILLEKATTHPMTLIIDNRTELTNLEAIDLVRKIFAYAKKPEYAMYYSITHNGKHYDIESIINKRSIRLLIINSKQPL
jgi:hypothetical protein